MGVLSGVRVLELAAIGPVPWCVMLLADMGADIVRIDRPGSGKGQEPMGRGRVSVELDLKQAAGLAHARELVACADVLIEGMRPGAAERLGLGPDTCLQLNPALVFARMTGWGQDGPLAARAGHDLNYIALTGALHAIGRGDKPVPPLNLVGDYGGGGAFLAIGLLAALLKARQTGQGEVVDVAMVDGAASLMALHYERLASGRWTDQRESNALDGGAPWYDVYRTRDGGFIAVGAIEAQFYAQLLEGLGLKADEVPDRASPAHWPAIRALFEQRFAQRSRDEWAAHFEGTDACVTPVLSMHEAMKHPHNRERQTFTTRGEYVVPGMAPRFRSQARGTAPDSTGSSIDSALARWRAGRGFVSTAFHQDEGDKQV
ncbi:CaiB/BaiF CoA transferase family protein [Variovorax terrae]|uniref:CoA transferase n=1 Tax=Variovorax terrae TaxID=2923278 RepID=A0A9X1VT20_9BURK|nr:CaiB/BaiF CoA-transferase family protein [Variovorax terrae]MCJ0762579.1 CoA transferase [Variovorax terrae]